MTAIELALVNRSTVSAWDDALFAGAARAFEQVANTQFLPAWGALIGVDKITVHYIGKAEAAPTGPLMPYTIELRDASDEPGDLGYHLYDNGAPHGYVFLADDLKDGADPVVTWTHEAFEAIADPKTIWTVPLGDAFLAVEVCDPVEADTDAITAIAGSSIYRVSNFVTPRWFGLGKAAGAWDARGLLKGPMPLLRPGGYQLEYRAGQWTQVTARLAGAMPPRALRAGRKALILAGGAPLA